MKNYQRTKGSNAILLALCLCFLSACSSSPSSSNKLERLVVFGDSNVDTGNLAKLFGGAVPRRNTWQGRNSNGPVVTEYLAKKLNVELVTYAVSGATTGESNIVSILAPQLTAIANTGTLKQIRDFKSDGYTLSQGDLVILWAGSNDIFRADRNNKQDLEQRITSATGNLGVAIDQVIDLGAQKIVIGLRTPRPQLDSDNDLNGQDLNQAIVKSIRIRQANSPAELVIFDAYAAIKNMIMRPDAYGFDNVSDLCVDNDKCAAEEYQAGLDIANTYLNWDAAHKTTRVHLLMASELQKVLQD